MFVLALCLGLASAAPEDPVEQARHLVSERLGHQVDPAVLDVAAISGMAELLDEELGTTGSRVLDAAEHTRHMAWLHGQRTGIGAEFALLAGRGLAITAVFEEGPAARAGLSVGDLVVAVDDQPFTGKGTAEILQRLEAASGGQLTLDVRRGEAAIQRIIVPRGSYQLPGVEAAEDGHPLLRIAFLGAGSADALRSHLARHDPSLGLVLDLRDAAGGSLDEAIAAASLFLEEDAVVTLQHTATDGDTVHRARGGDPWSGRLVLIINRGSAGPVEALAAALQHHKRAVLVGTPTAGQGALSSFHPLGGGLVLQLHDITLARPDGRSWREDGLRPDLMVEAAGLSLPPPGRPQALTDLQRDAALQVLGAQTTP